MSRHDAVSDVLSGWCVGRCEREGGIFKDIRIISHANLERVLILFVKYPST